MESLTKALSAVTPPVGVSWADVERLSSLANAEIAGSLLDYLRSVAGPGDSERFAQIADRIEWSHWTPARHQLMDVRDIVEFYRGSAPQPLTPLLCMPIGWACPGFGGYVLVPLGLDDPPVFGCDASGRTIALLSLKLSQFGKGLLLPEQLWGTPHRLAKTIFNADTQVVDLAETVPKVDAILDELSHNSLSPRGTPDSLCGLDLRELIYPSSGAGSPTVDVDATDLRSRSGLWDRLLAGTALLSAYGGTVVDGLGIFGMGAGATIGSSNLRSWLAESASADYDDHLLGLQRRIASNLGRVGKATS